MHNLNKLELPSVIYQASKRLSGVVSTLLPPK